jgi:mRNA-degrading endonuclease toxin of MazEF toxin-antitoxin module
LTVLRGHIYLATLPGVEGERPVLVVSSNLVNSLLKPIVVQVTSVERERSLTTFVVLEAGEGGLWRRSYALCHEIHTLDADDLGDEPLGLMISWRRLAEVERALSRALGLPEVA